MTRHPVSADTIQPIAEWLGFESGANDARIAESVSTAIEGYAQLADDAPADRPRSGPTPDDVVFDAASAADPHNAYITRFTMADEVADGPLSGLDIAVKDNVAVAGVPMTCGSRVLADVSPGSNATVVDRLLDAGARIVGKTNQTEFAFGPAGELSQFGPIANPRDPGRLAGGSSGGSAAAVAEGSADASIGSDTGGSVRVPAALCGIVGFKPTWGVVPRYGFVEMAWSLDHLGPMAADVETVAKVFDAIVGFDRRDDATVRAGHIPSGECASRVRDAPDIDAYSFAVLEDHLGDAVDDDVRTQFDRELGRIEDAGARVEPVSLGSSELVDSVTNAILVTEFAASFRHRGAPIGRRQSVDTQWHDDAAAALRANGDQLGELVRTKAIEGTYLIQEHDARHYTRARNESERIRDELATTLDEFDAVVSPTVPTVAPERGTVASGETASDSRTWALQLVAHTRPANVSGAPAITVPGGTVDGLPVGIQFLGRPYADAAVLRIARAYERLPT